MQTICLTFLLTVFSVISMHGNTFGQGDASLSGLPLAARSGISAAFDPWVQLAELTTSDGGNPGIVVAISGNTVVAGVGTNNGAGPYTVYVFVEPASGWANMTETAKLTASDGQNGDGFGGSIGISGDTIIVGAPGFYGDSFSGAAYVFVKPKTGWPI
jgi:FG-GAP repeat